MNEIREGHVGDGVEVIRLLSEDIGPRPPCGDAERAAADVIESRLSDLGLESRRETFSSARSFGPAYAVVFGAAVLAAALERRAAKAGALTGAAAAAFGVLESRFSRRSPARLLRRSISSNVHAVIEPSAEAAGTVCLVSHMDSSRSGLMFHPRVTPRLGVLVEAAGLAVATNALAPLLSLHRAGRAVLSGARLLLVTALALLVERELRGVDVAGANDNASGVGACLALAGHFSENPPVRTRIVVLVTGSEESGVVGMRNFLESHETDGWRFLNFDGVGADAKLRVLTSEGGPLSGYPGDAELLRHAEAVGAEHPGLAAAPLAGGSGLPYDSTPVLASGGHAISLVNQDGAIPNYHWPSDVYSEISPAAFGKAVRFGLKLVERLDSESVAESRGKRI